jgi:small subunit ribosomal protein S20
MANHKSSKARIIRTAKVTKVNTMRKSALRTSVKKVELAIASGDATAAKSALRDAQPKLQRESAKGILNKKAAARKVSRLSARIKKLDTK